MQIYPRIANPYMPNGTPDKTNAPSPYYAPGELGYSFNDQNTGGSYLRVQVDSGCTASTPAGALAAGQVMYWKNAAPGISTVTNDSRFADIGPAGAVNRVAGILQLAATVAPGVNGPDGLPQLYMVDLILQKNNVSVQASGTLYAGTIAMANNVLSGSGSAAYYPPNAIAAQTSVGGDITAFSQQLGVWTSATVASGLGTCDVNITFID